MSDLSLRVGSILGRSLSIWGKNFVPFLVLAVLVHIPVGYLVYDLLQEIHAGNFSKSSANIIQLVELLCAQFLTAALIFGTVMELRGTRAGLMACVRVGLVRAIPAILVAIFMWLAIGVGLVLLIIPGLMVWTILYVSIPVSVLERPGIFASLSRSGELTKFHRLKIFGLVIVFLGASYGAGRLLQKVIFDPFDLSTYSTYLYASIAVKIVLAIFGAIVAAVTYHDLRAIKDGVNVDELAAVFE